ncbi:MAG TPA: hypothetical protein V6C72_18030, partial [Chroococcales cyanobacterium]
MGLSLSVLYISIPAGCVASGKEQSQSQNSQTSAHPINPARTWPPLDAREHKVSPLIYLPPLPEESFLSEEQARIYKEKQPRLEDLFYFADAMDVSKPELRDLPCQIKAWTVEEKADMYKIIERALKRAPGLMIRAVSGNKLALCRTGVAPRYGGGGPHAPADPAAFSGRGAL